ncbi:hypothetical protein [Methanotorris formicicus]|uniref:Uncharacterized protein n=1 Tax=Methanotorris formicicus Mc-S-70 TaxID=647171 RepID=H1KYE9_9EURY|nr:hypothetical protein [Methanotorris formicicus]EHP87233.1 hypothetical protein MetfoDRAFT_0822 [Methanotorris formicicus Mc-S-70]
MRGEGVYLTYLFILGSLLFVEVFVFSLIYFVYGLSLKTVVGVLAFGLVLLLISIILVRLLDKLINEKNKGKLIKKYTKSKILNKKYKILRILLFVVGVNFYIFGWLTSLNINPYTKFLLYSISAFFIIVSVSIGYIKVEFYENGIFINPLGFYKWGEVDREDLNDGLILKINNLVIECKMGQIQ